MNFIMTALWTPPSRVLPLLIWYLTAEDYDAIVHSCMHGAAYMYGAACCISALTGEFRWVLVNTCSSRVPSSFYITAKRGNNHINTHTTTP